MADVRGEEMEPALETLLGDPVLRAMMVADGVDPVDLAALIEHVVRKLGRGRAIPPQRR
jgi:hypothetical protein